MLDKYLVKHQQDRFIRLLTDVDTIIFMQITDEEYETSDNEEELIKTIVSPKSNEYEAKVAEIDGINEQIALIDAEIFNCV